MRTLGKILALSGSLLAIAVLAKPHKKEMTDAEYTAKVLSAAPKAIAEGAAVVRVEKDGSMRTLREGKNGFTCLAMGTDKMCNDANSMEFIHALMKKAPPPEKIGISYMLAGDEGASNTDPYATGKTADNHWIVTGPHIMVFGPPSKTLGYTKATDPDPTKPYMMWAGTPYEHANDPNRAAEIKGESRTTTSIRLKEASQGLNRAQHERPYNPDSDLVVPIHCRKR